MRQTFRGFALAMAAALLAALPQVSMAGPVVASVAIDDHNDPPGGTLGAGVTGTVLNRVVTVVQEATGVLGSATITFDYLSSAPPTNGTVVTKYNIYETSAFTTISDTLSITASVTTAVQGANTHVEVVFKSDSTDGVLPPALASATSIAETGSFQTVSSGVSDLSVGFNSDVDPVPEPATITLFGLGAIGLAGYSRRKRAAAASV